MSGPRALAGEALFAWRALTRPRFAFRGRAYAYLVARHGHAWLTERAVEVPLGAAAVEAARAGGGRILEVGNVLRNYGWGGHDVLDKYEPGPGLLNEDAVDFTAPRPYDLVVSLSTVEHVGWDETPRDPGKALRALGHLAQQLARGGRMVFTFPLGYHPGLDEALARGDPALGEVGFLRRVSAWNAWREATWEEVRGARYGAPYTCGNAVAVGEVRA